MKTLVVNMFGGPSAGKSSAALELTAHLKWNGINAEYVHEYAKDVVWDKRYEMFENQIYIFAKQHHAIFRLLNQVDVIVTDSPLPISVLYNRNHKHLNDTIINEFSTFNNLNFYIKRTKPYFTVGRYQNQEEAYQIDGKLLLLLDAHDIPYVTLDGREGVSKAMTDIILKVREQDAG